MIKYPQITAVMVTLGRMDLVMESRRYFKNQTYPAKHLLIATDCVDPSLLQDMARHDKELSILHIKSHGERLTLGELRNFSIEHAPSDLTIQWDDDDWFGPTRIMDQWSGLKKGARAVLLTEQLHYFKDTAEVGWVVVPSGIEGTVLLDRRCGLKYPCRRRGEDTLLKDDLIKRHLLNLVPGGVCYCRTYHGENTWDRKHHVNRIHAFGKTQIDRSQLRKAATMYGWPDNWKVIFGKENV